MDIIIKALISIFVFLEAFVCLFMFFTKTQSDCDVTDGQSIRLDGDHIALEIRTRP